MDQEQQLSYLMEKKLQLLVEMQTKKYEQDIAQLKEQLASVMSQLQTVQSNVKGLRQDVSLPQTHKVPEPPVRQEVQLNLQQPPKQEQPLYQPQPQAQTQPAQPQGIPLSNGGEQRQLPTPPQKESVTAEKCGDWTPEDVSVDKFFYFGTK